MSKQEKSEWFEKAVLGEYCTHNMRCEYCRKNGVCESCDTIDGRYVSVVSDYASTCDGCGELTDHGLLEMDMETQLGYCQECQKQMNNMEREG